MDVEKCHFEYLYIYIGSDVPKPTNPRVLLPVHLWWCSLRNTFYVVCSKIRSIYTILSVFIVYVSESINHYINIISNIFVLMLQL